LGFDSRESTPGVKRKIVISAADARSFRVASNLLDELADVKASPNTIERICLDAGGDLQATADENWKGVLTGEAIVPEVAAVLYDGGRIRTREPNQGPGVHLNGKGWNETKNAIFVSAKSTVSDVDPEPEPPTCFFNPNHVAKLTDQAKTKEKTGSNDAQPEPKKKSKPKKKRPAHKPKRLLRTVISSMKNSTEFGKEMKKEAARRNFAQASRKAFIADGLACNWSIHAEHFRDYIPILDFVHAVTYVYRVSIVLHGKTEQAWKSYMDWMTAIWKGKADEVIADLRQHQSTMGLPEADTPDDEPREQLRVVLQYLENNLDRMKYDQYRMQGLPTTSAWMESTVKEVNYRIKGTEMFWNNPKGAEAILHIRAARLSDDGRLYVSVHGLRLEFSLGNLDGGAHFRVERSFSRWAAQ
jgi:hypothetical protein